jgi:hypothetical protein
MFIQPINVTSVQVVAVQPERADIKRLDFIRTNESVTVENYYYIVKVYLENQHPASTEALRLYVGREEVPKYGGFCGGLYFKVYTPAFFENHAGEILCFSLDGKTFLETGAKLPQKPELLPTRTRVDSSTRLLEMAPSIAEDSTSQTLPTKDEVLRQ